MNESEIKTSGIIMLDDMKVLFGEAKNLQTFGIGIKNITKIIVL